MTHCVSPFVEVIVDGNLDEQMLPKLQDRLEEALELGPSLLRVDLAGCPAIAEQSWQVLLATQAQAERQGTQFVLRGCNRAARLRVGRMTTCFNLEPVAGAAGWA